LDFEVESDISLDDLELKEKDEELKEKDESYQICRLYILKHSPESIAKELKLTFEKVNSLLDGVLQEEAQ
jgi:hypothetical protein